MPIPANDPRIRLVTTSFVTYYHVDLTQAAKFLTDFGMTIIEDQGDTAYFGGYGQEQYVYVAKKALDGVAKFGGPAYEVESRTELERASKITGASDISALNAPGGGEIVTLTDPVGHLIHLVYGQEKKTPVNPNDKGLEQLHVNYELDKPRLGSFHRFKRGPAPVFRWGHYGVTYSPGAYQDMFTWYTTTLALAPSDIVYKDNEPITCFFHIDRGQEYTDHHAFFFKPAKPGGAISVAHSAFEVHDFDIQQLGHNYLEKQGYNLCWGVGRHVLGSQVFDYWFDPSRFIVEHYADGDLVNCDTEVSHLPAGPDALSIWGPPVPSVF